MTKNWMDNARVSLSVVLSVIGPEVNSWPCYQSARRMCLAQRQSVYNNALKVLLTRLSDEQRKSCRGRMEALVRSENKLVVSLTGGAVL